MKDFTLRAYQEYVRSLQESYRQILRFDEFFSANPRPHHFCIVRHDVDRKPDRALRMAQLENLLGLKATYFFRAKRHTLIPATMRAICELGHEVGYHYESLSDARGNRELAKREFENKLATMRKIVPVRTAAMHGRPFSKFNNLDLWQDPDEYSQMKKCFGLLGEVYLDINYSDIVYITDTGRNWSSGKSNRRDEVQSEIKKDFKNGKQLLKYFKNNPHPKFVFSVHPERWTDSLPGWLGQMFWDQSANIAKKLVN
jgi:hypothetical protein